MTARSPLSAALGGAAFGLAAATVEVWGSAAQIMSFNMRFPLGIVVSGSLLIVAMGTLVGLVTVRARPHGRAWHWLAMAIIWVAIQEYAAPEGRFGRMFVLGTPLGALLLLAIGAWMERWGRWLPVTLCMLLFAAGIATPELSARRHTPAPAPVAALPPAPPGAPDVVIVVLDTVRADHLGAFGYPKPTSPSFDALAKDATLFTDAVSPATWSLPSHASLFTGRFVSAHGAHDEHKFLDGDTPTLAETLAAAGYDTRSFTANSWISDSLGMIRGFRWTDEAWRNGDVARTTQAMHRLLDRLGFGGADKGGAGVTTTFENWLASRPKDDRPAFVFLNFIEAHFPYHQVPADYLARFTTRSRRELRGISSQLVMATFGGDLPSGPDVVVDATAMYDAGIAYADHLLGRVVEALRRRGSLDHTILVVLADHGEMLGEHGEFGHGHSLYEPVLHVPLLVRYPATVPAGRRVATPVSPVGVYATVLDLAGLPPAPSVEVGSLVPVIDGKPHPGPVLSEQYSAMLGSAPTDDDPLLRKDARFRAYRSGRRKLIEAQPGGVFLFDLDRDPGEQDERAMKERLAVGALRDELETWLVRLGLPDIAAPVTKRAPKSVDPAAEERLRQLGYVE